MIKNGIGIDNLQWLIGYKTKPDQTIIYYEITYKLYSFKSYIYLNVCK